MANPEKFAPVVLLIFKLYIAFSPPKKVFFLYSNSKTVKFCPYYPHKRIV